MNDLLRDFRYAFRMLRRKPAFAGLTILILAIGVGANTAVFSIVDRTLLRPLPYVEPDRLVQVWETRANQSAAMRTSYPNFSDWKKRSHVFEDLAGYDGTNLTLTGSDTPIRISAVRATTNMLSILGVKPQLGRDFLPEEEALDNSRVAIVTHAFWREQLGGRQDAVGQALRLGGVPYTIVGVLPPDFEFMADPFVNCLLPLGFTQTALLQRDLRGLNVVGRLKPDVNLNAADSELKAVARQLESEYPQANGQASVRLVALQEQLVGGLRSTLLVVFGAAACMLLLAFISLTNLVVAQFIDREREMGIRGALGAGVLRLARQIVSECLLLACISGVVSIAVANWTLRVVLAVVPRTQIPNLIATDSSNFDERVLLFNGALALAGGVIVSVIAIARLSRSSLKDLMNSGGRAVRAHSLRSVLTVSEVALAVTLLVGTVVMIQSVQRLARVDPGFRTSGLVAMQLSLPAARYSKDEDVIAFYQEVQSRTAAIPGVQNAGVIDELPLTHERGTVGIFPDGRQPPRPGEESVAVIRAASPNYFETMGVPVVLGRTFKESDNADSRPVVVLSETLRRTLFPDTDPVGRYLVLPGQRKAEVIGVVGDVHLADLDRETRPTVYTSGLQVPSRSSVLVFWTTTGLAELTSQVRSEVHQLDPDLPVYGVRSIEEALSGTRGVAIRRLVLYLVGAFGVIGMLMAALGLYGLMNFLAVQRSKEIGIRIALGAQRGDIRRWAFHQAFSLTGIGFLVGIAAAIASGRLMRSVMFGVTPSSPSVLVVVTVFVAAIAYAACYFPMRRAVRTDPVIVLRQE